MKLYGIMGAARSGKNTVASLVAESGARVRCIAFADALKDEVCAALGITRAELDVDKERFRPILQWWGTEWRRAQNPNYWLEKLAAALPWHEDVNLFVPDVRFQNEAELIRNLGGTLIRVDRPGGPVIHGMEHPSENDWRVVMPDVSLVNGGTLDDFRIMVQTWLRCSLQSSLEPV